MGPESDDLCPYKKKRGHRNREEGHVKMEAEVGVLQLKQRNSKDLGDLPEAGIWLC